MEKILKVFVYNKGLKFSELEKLTKMRSNHLAYHLKNLTKKGILEKEKDFYKLSETSESLIPYLSEKKSPLPVILIHIGDNKKTFLHKRGKRPFIDYLSLPGGRLLTNESISEATKRIMKKFNINAKYKRTNSISLEHVKNKNKIIHTFLLILVTATTQDKISLTEIEKNKSKIIKSDYKLLKNNLNHEEKIKIIYSKD